MTAAGGWRKARRVARTDAGQFFARAGCPVEKPRNPHAYLEGQRPARRGIRGAVSFGYFSLGKQRKVTRSPAGGRKPAAGEPGRDPATTADSGPRMTAAGGWRKARRVARRDAGQFFARAGCPVEKPRNPHAH